MNKKECKLIIERLIDNGFNPGIFRGEGYSFDEPSFFVYITHLKVSHKFTDGPINKLKDSVGAGFSFNTPIEALFKSLYEAMERFCYYCYRKKDIKYEKYKDKANFINPSNFLNKKNAKDFKFGWVKAVDAFNEKECFIPAQLVYFNYKLAKNEPQLDFPRNSNGGALGSGHEQALLNGIYEVIERDAFMNTYLNKTTPHRVNLMSFNDSVINMILEKSKRYKLEIYVLDVANDISIPSFLSIIIDRTGLGPSISLGAKTELNSLKAIIGAIGESFMARQYAKSLLKYGVLFGDPKKRDENFFAERAEYWFPLEKIKEIKFLLSGKISNKKYDDFTGTKKHELSLVLNILKKHNKDVYYSDIAIKEFKKLGFLAFKVIIPGLQPLYLREEEKERSINKDRLEEVAKFFGKEYGYINPVPHPFL